MFFLRLILSTAALPLVASTAAGRIQETVLDDVTNDNVSTMVHCDNLTTVAFPKTGYQPSLERVEGGMDACIYDFDPGWPSVTVGGTVGKTPNVKRNWPSKPGSESWVLKQIGELYAHTRDTRERDWIVMKKQHGEWLSRTTQYGGIRPEDPTCPKFFQDVYRAVYLDAWTYISQFGCIHAKGIGMNEANVLLEFDEADHPTAHLVGWGDADCSGSNKRDAVNKARILCMDYVWLTGGPRLDCDGQFDYHQARAFCADLH